MTWFGLGFGFRSTFITLAMASYHVLVPSLSDQCLLCALHSQVPPMLGQVPCADAVHMQMLGAGASECRCGIGVVCALSLHSGSFMVLHFIFLPVIHFDLIMLKGVMSVSSFMLCTWMSSGSSTVS